MSNMIFSCDFWWRYSYPKFYNKTVGLMKSANGKAFLTENDLSIFIDLLRKQIDADKPKGHAAHISFSGINKDGKGHVYVESGKLDTDIARLFFHRVKSIVTYGEHKQAVFDVQKGGGV